MATNAFVEKHNLYRITSHFVHAILADCGALKVQQNMPEGIKLRKIYGKIGSKQRTCKSSRTK